MNLSLESEFAQEVERSWWVSLLQGILMLVLGFFLMFQTQQTLVFLIWILGIYWLIKGVFNLIWVVVGRIQLLRGWVIFSSIVGIIVGLLIIGQPLIAAAVPTYLLAYILAFAALVGGLVQVFTAFRFNKAAGGKFSWAEFLLGLLWGGIGVLLLFHPLVSIVVMAWLMAIFLVIGGLLGIVFAFSARKWAKEIESIDV